ncbi:GtrA family protein [Chimaeribacter arupi]|uniref:GtrA family protein n=1 Tax=Chimaeribacter arupi TaxID=2060066 RepID=UPI000C7B2107|nr:GtrA family protein [Chimaeribacter arupi]PLR39054.1 translocase [Chimaeribacter arupi]
MIKLFTKYALVGVINTLIHWVTFALLYYAAGADQALSNFGAFCVAVTFSFFVNAKVTFKSDATTIRYMFYVLFMGALSVSVGWVAEVSGLPALFTLVTFSAVSLLVGFFYSRFFVFKVKDAQ